MGKQYLIGDKPGCLVPAEDLDARTPAQRRKSGRHGANRFATKHTKGQPDIRTDGQRRKKPGQRSTGDQHHGHGAQGSSKQGTGKQGNGKPNNKPNGQQRPGGKPTGKPNGKGAPKRRARV